MSVFSTPAILLRRLEYGDFDLILTFMSLERGKISLIAKSAKKSKKRFAGILELFSLIEAVASTGKGRGLPVRLEPVRLVRISPGLYGRTRQNRQDQKSPKDCSRFHSYLPGHVSFSKYWPQAGPAANVVRASSKEHQAC